MKAFALIIALLTSAVALAPVTANAHHSTAHSIGAKRR
jgi:hypothetical protein